MRKKKEPGSGNKKLEAIKSQSGVTKCEKVLKACCVGLTLGSAAIVVLEHSPYELKVLVLNLACLVFFSFSFFSCPSSVECPYSFYSSLNKGHF